MKLTGKLFSALMFIGLGNHALAIPQNCVLVGKQGHTYTATCTTGAKIWTEYYPVQLPPPFNVLTETVTMPGEPSAVAIMTCQGIKNVWSGPATYENIYTCT